MRQHSVRNAVVLLVIVCALIVPILWPTDTLALLLSGAGAVSIFCGFKG
jgi:hypothetical protein